MNSFYLHWSCGQVYTWNRHITNIVMLDGSLTVCSAFATLTDSSWILVIAVKWKGGMLHSKIRHFALQVDTTPVNSYLDRTADGDSPPEILSSVKARNSSTAGLKWWHHCTYNCGLSSWNIGGGLRYLHQFYRLAYHTCCYLQRQHRQPQ